MEAKELYSLWMEKLSPEDPLYRELDAIRDDEKEIYERFYQEIVFGTAGLRGICGAGTNRMNEKTVGRATQGIANYILSSGADVSKGVAIAYDCRYYSKEFSELVAAIMAGNGIRAYLFPSMRPTPELSFAIRRLGCISGVNMTASHNPKEYNGYKVYWSDGAQISGAVSDGMLAEIQKLDFFDDFNTMPLPEAVEKGLVVIADVKRGDIGSTSLSYAQAHLGGVKIGDSTFSGFDADFATVNPYLGTDGVKPFIDVCNTADKGIFVLVKTSNPSSGEFQDRLIDGRPLYEIVGEQVEKWGLESMDGTYSNVGAVVGATYPEMGKILREIMPHAYILVPGYGAQGGKGKDLVHFFNKDGLGAIVNSSRGIIAAWKSDSYKEFSDGRVGEAARAAALDMKKDIEDALQRRV